MELQKSPVLKIDGSINTTYAGISKIVHFFNEAQKFQNTTVSIDFRQLKWMDANLLALFNAFVYKLGKERNVKLVTDFDFLADKFNVFFRSGAFGNDAYRFADIPGTTIPYKYFYPSEVNKFVEYISLKLMCHGGLHSLDTNLRKRIQGDLIEIFQNLRHAQTEAPFFACGQYYPTKGHFKLTMVDLGIGFLEPIKKFTNGTITTDLEAIKWAVNGNSSYTSSPLMGGFGLQSIHQYCNTGKGAFQIYSGYGFWDSDVEKSQYLTHSLTNSSFSGSVINLVFR